ncbi:MAG: DUF2442 domain-containing protein [Rhodomicrobium sp.]
MKDNAQEISEAEFERANRRMAKRRATEPFAIAASFDEQRRMIAVSLNNGVEVKFPADKMQGLSGAKPEDLADIEISPAGYGLHFPKLDAGFSLPGLLACVFATRQWMAAISGAKGGKPAGERKVLAAKAKKMAVK